MGVAHMKDSVSVELSRQFPQSERQLDQLEIEGITLPLFMERREAETCAERAEECGEQPFAPAGATAGGTDPVPAVLQKASLNGPIGRRMNQPVLLFEEENVVVGRLFVQFAGTICHDERGFAAASGRRPELVQQVRQLHSTVGALLPSLVKMADRD